MKNVNKRSRQVILSRINIARSLFYVNAAVWLLIGGVFVYSMVEDKNGWYSALPAFFFLMVILSLLAGARIIHQPERWVYVTAIVIVLINFLLTFIGFPDVLFILAAVMDVFIFASLFPIRSHYSK